jgi:DNA-binding GntR family transcriptional regulator
MYTVDVMQSTSVSPGALEHLRLRDAVAARLQEMIVTGQLEPGSRLYEGKIAEEFEISRNPVREAMLWLEARGLVFVIPRRGTYVARVDLEELRQIEEVRGVVEALAVERAAQRRSAADITRLQDCINRGIAHKRAGDNLAAAAAHREFHETIGRTAGNDVLDGVLRSLRQQAELTFLVLQDERRTTWEEHQVILDAIAAGDSAVAARLMREHIAGGISLIEGRLPVQAASSTSVGAPAAS